MFHIVLRIAAVGQIWTSTGDADHAWIVGAYFHCAGGFEYYLFCYYSIAHRTIIYMKSQYLIIYILSFLFILLSFKILFQENIEYKA